MKNILLVHENWDILKSIGQYLEWFDYNVDHIDNSKEVIPLIGRKDHDIIISDIFIRPLNGYELSRMIREDKEEKINSVNIVLVGMEEPDLKNSKFLEKYGIYYINGYRRVSIWIDKINSILSRSRPEVVGQ